VAVGLRGKVRDGEEARELYIGGLRWFGEEKSPRRPGQRLGRVGRDGRP
jgi:hypothetical protein